MKNDIKPAEGKLGVLCVGLGAVSTTLITGTLMARKGLANPVGSFTQIGKMRVGRGDKKQYKHVGEIVPMTDLKDVVFGAWDVFTDNAYESALYCQVLKREDIEPVRDELERIKPMKACFDPDYAKNLVDPQFGRVPDPLWAMPTDTRWNYAQNLRRDIQNFKKENGCSRVIVFWIASTESYTPRNEAVHGSIAGLEVAMKADDRKHLPPSMIYAYAALMEGCPFIMGAPNVCVDIPAFFELSKKQGLPIVGKDFKSGQTMMKSAMAPIFRTRMLGVEGWFSTNILGNRDGQVIEHPDNFETKRISKASSIEWILEQDEYPELYTDIYHKVKINYYPPRKDNKESWDNIDIFGWMNYPMQIKVNFLCRDSILAAPICLDLMLFTDLALRAGLSGVQEWLSFYVKKPMTYDDERPVHDLFQQFAMLKNQIRLLGGYEADQELD
ncbi:MAG: inositol-3-phosphate synthase [Bacteroidaceae bacterium]|nr:inositol-3-phosphate synthase [Bacteroidaceae bacterium]